MLQGNLGPVIDPVLWKRMYRGIQVYKGTKLADKVAISPAQVRRKIEYMMEKGEHLTVNGASIILAELFGVLTGLRRSEHFASAVRQPNLTTLLCFRNLTGTSWDLGDCSRRHCMASWASNLSPHEILKVRNCYTKHQRHRVAHEVVAGPGYRHMSIALWLRIVVKLRLQLGEDITPASPLLVRRDRGKVLPMTGNFMAKMDKIYAPILGWHKATIHSRRRGFATAAVKSGVHMANITIAMRHSQGVTMQYIALSLQEKASITTRLAIAAYNEHVQAPEVLKTHG